MDRISRVFLATYRMAVIVLSAYAMLVLVEVTWAVYDGWMTWRELGQTVASADVFLTALMVTLFIPVIFAVSAVINELFLKRRQIEFEVCCVMIVPLMLCSVLIFIAFTSSL